MCFKVFHNELEFFDHVTNHKGHFNAKQMGRKNGEGAKLDLSHNVPKKEDAKALLDLSKNMETNDQENDELDTGKTDQGVKQEAGTDSTDATIDDPDISTGNDPDGNQGNLNVSLEEGSQDIIMEKNKNGDVVYTCNVCHSFKGSIE